MSWPCYTAEFWLQHCHCCRLSQHGYTLETFISCTVEKILSTLPGLLIFK